MNAAACRGAAMKKQKVYSVWQHRRVVPQIKMQWQWLAAAGLSILTRIWIRRRGRKLIIQAEEKRE